jgi:hypothetical protein
MGIFFLATPEIIWMLTQAALGESFCRSERAAQAVPQPAQGLRSLLCSLEWWRRGEGLRHLSALDLRPSDLRLHLCPGLFPLGLLLSCFLLLSSGRVPSSPKNPLQEICLLTQNNANLFLGCPSNMQSLSLGALKRDSVANPVLLRGPLQSP